MDWIHIPFEIRLAIVRYLDRPTLRSLRLANKQSGSSIATPLLFETINLCRDVRSVKHANNIAASSYLNAYVTTLTYHHLYSRLECLGSYNDFRTRVVNLASGRGEHLATRASTPSEDEIKGLFDARQNSYGEEQEFKSDANDELWAIRLVVSKLQKLRCVIVPSNTECSVLPREKEIDCIYPDDFIAKILHSDGHHTASTLAFILDLPLKEIDVGFFAWTTFYNDIYLQCKKRQQSIPQGLHNFVTFQHLQALKLSIGNNWKDPTSANVTDELLVLEGLLIASERTLSHLSLSFGTHNVRHHTSHKRELGSVCPVIFARRWRKLVSFELRDVVTDEDPFVNFLERHRSTLKELHLGNIEIIKRLKRSHDISDNTEDIGIGSVISFLHRVPQYCQLSRATLVGNFGNQQTEAWVAHPSSQTGNLRHRLEQYCCQAGSWPFVDFDVWMTLLRLRSNISRIDGFDHAPITPDCYDSSWCWDSMLLRRGWHHPNLPHTL